MVSQPSFWVDVQQTREVGQRGEAARLERDHPVAIGQQLVGARQAQPAGAVEAHQGRSVAGFDVPDVEPMSFDDALVEHLQLPQPREDLRTEQFDASPDEVGSRGDEDQLEDAHTELAADSRGLVEHCVGCTAARE